MLRVTWLERLWQVLDVLPVVANRVASANGTKHVQNASVEYLVLLGRLSDPGFHLSRGRLDLGFQRKNRVGIVDDVLDCDIQRPFVVHNLEDAAVLETETLSGGGKVHGKGKERTTALGTIAVR